MRSQASLPIPTVHANRELRSRMATFLVRSSILARVERTVRIADGVLVTDRTRKVADRVSGASTRCGSMEPGRVVMALVVSLDVCR